MVLIPFVKIPLIADSLRLVCKEELPHVIVRDCALSISQAAGG
jgi:hypothetical protein